MRSLVLFGAALTLLTGCASTPPQPGNKAPLETKMIRLPEGGHLIEFDARTEWAQTGLVLRPGIRVSFKATGSWGESPGENRSADGGAAGMFGSGYWGRLRHDPDSPWGCLIGRVGNQRFFIGRERTIEIVEEGSLLLSINDAPGYFQDNHGSMSVRVSVLP